jgi:hypothetical protein
MAFLTIYLLASCRPRSTFVLVCMHADPACLLVTRRSRRRPSPQHLLHTHFIRARWPTPVYSLPAARALGPRPMCARCGPPCAQSSLPPSPAWLSIPAPCAPNRRCSCARCPLLLCSIYALCTLVARRSLTRSLHRARSALISYCSSLGLRTMCARPSLPHTCCLPPTHSNSTHL